MLKVYIGDQDITMYLGGPIQVTWGPAPASARRRSPRTRHTRQRLKWFMRQMRIIQQHHRPLSHQPVRPAWHRRARRHR